MPAARVPSPEAGAERIYVRDKANVSRPIAWVSQDRAFVLFDDGELLVRAGLDDLHNRRGRVHHAVPHALMFRLVVWLRHGLNLLGIDRPRKLEQLLGMNDEWRFLPEEGGEA